MSRQVLIFSEWLFWSVLALILWMQTGAFSEEIAEYKFGADGWPKMVIIGIVVGATGQAIIKLMDRSASAQDDNENDAKPAVMTWQKRVQQLAIFGMPLLYLWAMHRIGFFVASPLFIMAYLWVLEVRNWCHILGVTAIILALLFFVFVRLFYVAVPVGAWESFYAINNEIITYIRLGL